MVEIILKIPSNKIKIYEKLSLLISFGGAFS